MDRLFLMIFGWGGIKSLDAVISASHPNSMFKMAVAGDEHRHTCFIAIIDAILILD